VFAVFAFAIESATACAAAFFMAEFFAGVSAQVIPPRYAAIVRAPSLS
jgi:hypothetical protein